MTNAAPETNDHGDGHHGSGWPADAREVASGAPSPARTPARGSADRPASRALDREPRIEAAARRAPQSAPPEARLLWWTAPGRCEWRSETLPAAPGAGQVRVRALHSGISRGTERLVATGRVPESEWARMRAPHQRGAFPFPVAYGYCFVGEVEAVGPQAAAAGWRPADRIFALHPHATRCDLATTAVQRLPEALPSRRAVLAANAETALNACFDLAAVPGERVAVVGAGVLGLLVAAWLAPLPELELVVVDPVFDDPDLGGRRRAVAERLGIRRVQADVAGLSEFDAVVHTSANPAGLAAALDVLGDEGRVIELSWYGDTAVPLPLGGAFHARRLTIRSSQVGRVALLQAPRWTPARRLQTVLAWLCDARFDTLLDESLAWYAAPDALFARLGQPGLCLTLDYRSNDVSPSWDAVP